MEKNSRVLEDARQTNQEDVPMLAVGAASLWSLDRNDMSIISEGSLELSQDEPPPPETGPMSHCARESGSRSPGKNYAKLEDGVSSIRSDDQDRFLARDVRHLHLLIRKLRNHCFHLGLVIPCLISLQTALRTRWTGPELKVLSQDRLTR